MRGLRRIYAIVSFASTVDWGLPKLLAVLGAGVGTAAVTEILRSFAGLPSPWLEFATLFAAWVLVTALFTVVRMLTPEAAAMSAGPTATTSGEGAAIAAMQDAAQTMYKHSGSGNLIVQSESNEERAAKAEAELKRQQQAMVTNAKRRDDKKFWLAGLASLRNVGVARRNQLGDLKGDDAKIQAMAKYTAWLMLAVKHIRTLPLHGLTEAWAFETLDRFRLDAAPAGDYASDEIRTIAAMFSTHLERLEELRKRYTHAPWEDADG